MMKMEFDYLPEKYRAIHKACFELIQQIEEFIIGKEYWFLKEFELKLTKEEKECLDECGDVWEYLKKYDKEQLYKLLSKQLILGLLMDFCYFMGESMDCSKKRKLVVSYALLRKPLVDNLIILLRIMFDKSFFDKFIERDDYDPASAKDDEVKELLNKTDEWGMGFITGAEIYDCIFEKKYTGSVVNVSNKAIHPVTTRSWNKTGAMNLNFAFVTKKELTGLWKHYYAKLPAILVFYSDLFNRAIFDLFKDEVDMELYPKRMQRMLEILLPVVSRDKRWEKYYNNRIKECESFD